MAEDAKNTGAANGGANGAGTGTVTDFTAAVDQQKRRNNGAEVDKMGRERRVPIGKQTRTEFESREGFHRRLVSDIRDGARIRSFEKAGYRVVKEHTKGGDTRAGADTQMGTPVVRSVGGGTKGVLMEIPEEFYREDQQAKEDDLKRLEEGIKRKPQDPGHFGEIKIG